jgi:hypothetical protein
MRSPHALHLRKINKLKLSWGVGKEDERSEKRTLTSELSTKSTIQRAVKRKCNRESFKKKKKKRD